MKSIRYGENTWLRRDLYWTGPSVNEIVNGRWPDDIAKFKNSREAMEFLEHNREELEAFNADFSEMAIVDAP